MASSSSDDVLKIGSFQYLHVLDTNLNTVKVEVGPKTFTRLEHEKGALLGGFEQRNRSAGRLSLYSSFWLCSKCCLKS
mgnify:CR=1 FL=1